MPTPTTQLKRRVVDRLRAETRRLNDIQDQADELGIVIAGLDLRALAKRFEIVARHVDTQIDWHRWER